MEKTFRENYKTHMKTILFFPITFNLAVTTMAITIARAISDDFHCHFASYGGEYEPLIEKAGFPHTRLEPRFTPQIVKRIYALDQGRQMGGLHTADTVRKMALGELELYRRLHPAAVVTGMNPSACISCPTAKIPLVWVIQSGMAMGAAARLGELKNVDMLDTAPTRWLPDQFKAKLSEMLLDIAYTAMAKTFNQVAIEYGLEPFRSFDDVLWGSDYQLVAEPPGFSALQFPPTSHFIGPLIARLDTPLPEEIINLPRDLPLIYFAMGSSGQPGIVARILAGFAGKPYRVIAPVKHLLGNRRVRIPDNVHVTGLLPYKANLMADLSVIHGGIGTVMTACLAGKPVVGVAMSPEQFLNIEMMVAKGFAIRIPQGSLTAERLCNSIDRLLADSTAQARASEYRKVVEAWDTPQHIRNFFCETFGR